MKYSTLAIENTEYMLVFSNAVLAALEDQGIALSDLTQSSRPIGVIAPMVCAMIASGSRYARRNGLGDYPTLTPQEFCDMTAPADLERIQALMTDLILGDRHVDSAPPKKDVGDEEAAPTN